MRRRRVLLVALSIVWLATAVFLVEPATRASETVGLKLGGYALAVGPGVGLWVYVIAHPTTLYSVARLIAAAVGLVALALSAQVIVGGCGGDGQCGLNIYNGPVVDYAVFGLAIPAGRFIWKRRGLPTR